MLCLAVAVVLGPKGPMTGQEYVDKVKKMLADFGVGKVRLQRLSGRYGGEASRSLEVTDGAGRRYTAFFSSVMGATSVQVQPLKGEPFGSKDLKGTRFDTLARFWFSKLHVAETTQLRTLRGSKDRGSADFAILRNGYPIIGRNRCGYRLTFSIPDGRFLAYDAYEKVPTVVDSRPPTISKSQALKVLRDMYAEMNRHPRRTGTSYSYQLDGDIQLGYYTDFNDTTARLAWSIPFMAEETDVGGSRGGSSEFLVDAHTGKRITNSTNGR